MNKDRRADQNNKDERTCKDKLIVYDVNCYIQFGMNVEHGGSNMIWKLGA